LIIAAISDTHGRPFEIPECDVFIHAGDMTAGGSVDEQLDLLVWLGYQNQARHKILVPGNHDRCYEIYGEKLQASLLPRFRPMLLIDSALEIDGKIFYGSPWTPPFRQWSFMKPEEELAEVYANMPAKIDVLITHGPPRGILDPGYNDPHVGSRALLAAVQSRRISQHIFGHTHGAGGKTVRPKSSITKFHNVAAVDESYNLTQGCKIIELEPA